MHMAGQSRYKISWYATFCAAITMAISCWEMIAHIPQQQGKAIPLCTKDHGKRVALLCDNSKQRQNYALTHQPDPHTFLGKDYIDGLTRDYNEHLINQMAYKINGYLSIMLTIAAFGGGVRKALHNPRSAQEFYANQGDYAKYTVASMCSFVMGCSYFMLARQQGNEANAVHEEYNKLWVCRDNPDKVKKLYQVLRFKDITSCLANGEESGWFTAKSDITTPILSLHWLRASPTKNLNRVFTCQDDMHRIAPGQKNRWVMAFSSDVCAVKYNIETTDAVSSVVQKENKLATQCGDDIPFVEYWNRNYQQFELRKSKLSWKDGFEKTFLGSRWRGISNYMYVLCGW